MSSYFRSAAPLAILVALTASGGPRAQDASSLISDLNPAIVRWANGTYLYREGEAREIRGVETWRMTVAADGSRTFNMWYAVAKDELSTFAIYTVDRNFNPLSLYKTTWVGNTLTQLHSVIDGLELATTVRFDGKTVDQSMTAPGPFSVTVSPVRVDALHFARYDKQKGGAQASHVLGTVAAGAERTDIGRAAKTPPDSVGMKLFIPIDLEWLGEETVTVPAGRFVCDHYRIEKLVDMWVHGPDYLLVSYQWHPNHYSYELVEYAFGPASHISASPGFSWVVPGELAAMPLPGRNRPLDEDAAFLEQEGIGLLVSLTDEPPDGNTLTAHSIEQMHIPVSDFTAPTLDQMTEFVALVQDSVASGDPVGVHCTAGLGRSGTMAAVYLVSTGLTANEAIAKVRSLRPDSIETEAQENAIRDFEASLARTR